MVLPQTWATVTELLKLKKLKLQEKPHHLSWKKNQGKSLYNSQHWTVERESQRSKSLILSIKTFLKGSGWLFNQEYVGHI